MPKITSLAFSEDISPDLVGQFACTAGLTLAVAGDQFLLYAVSLNAGVWRSQNGGPWQQLPDSPPRAYCIAVDPNDHYHVVVGERADEVADPSYDDGGAWESLNGGFSWSYIFDPRKLLQSPSQVVPSVAITSSGAAVMACEGGITRRAKNGTTRAAQLPPGLSSNAVTAVVASASRVWARLAVTENHGRSRELL